jgi:hypothetical protein
MPVFGNPGERRVILEAEKGEKRTFYAWFSEKMRMLDGSAFYARSDGTIVEVTDVTPTPEHTNRWSDVEYRGEVVRYIGSKPGPYSFLLKDQAVKLRFLPLDD